MDEDLVDEELVEGETVSDATFQLWVLIVGQIVALAIVAWNKWEQRRQGKIAEKTYALTNSAYGDLAQVGETAAKRLADRTGEEGDAVLAQAALRLLLEHTAKQAALDAREGKPPSP